METYDMELEDDELVIFKEAMMNYDEKPGAYLDDNVLQLTEDRLKTVMDAVSRYQVEQMAVADAADTHGDWDSGEMDAIKVASQIGDRAHHEFHYGPEWYKEVEGGNLPDWADEYYYQ